MKTLIGIPVYKKMDSNFVRLIASIKDYTEGEYFLYVPVSGRSHSVQVNDCIVTAKIMRADYLCVIDADAWFDEKSIGWLQKYENCLTHNSDYGLLMWSNDYQPNNHSPQYADESQSTPYIASILWFYRISNNIWWDENYLYHQSSDVDFVREHRRHGIKTGYIPSVHINHLWDHNPSTHQHYERWKRLNEQTFLEKWGTTCHSQEFEIDKRNKFRGIYGRPELDLLIDVSDQHKQIVSYFDENPLFSNDIQYITKNNIPWDQYYDTQELQKLSWRFTMD